MVCRDHSGDRDAKANLRQMVAPKCTCARWGKASPYYEEDLFPSANLFYFAKQNTIIKS